jgi:hypothetical protein
MEVELIEEQGVTMQHDRALRATQGIGEELMGK